MRVWLIAFLAIEACGFPTITRVGGGGASSPPDCEKIDALPPCFGTYANVCLTAAPKTSITVAITMEINTDAGSSQCDAKTTQYCVIAATSFSIPSGATLSAHGARPLVLVSTDSTTAFQLAGQIDVSSSIKGTTPTTGAGANPTDCGKSMPMAATNKGGGFGGSFGSAG